MHGVVVISGTPQVVGSASGAIGFVFLFYVGLQLFFTPSYNPQIILFIMITIHTQHLSSFSLYNSLYLSLIIPLEERRESRGMG